MKLLSYLKKHLVFLDGGTGTLLQERGLEAGARPEEWNVDHPDEIRSIHRAYLDAGCHILTANTFGANPLRYPADRLEAIVSAAMENAKIARKEAKADRPIWIALDVGPTGRMLKPYGDLDFEDAVAAFAQTVRLGVRCGADLILIETMSDSYEAKAALLAARENSDLPVFVSCAFGSDGKLLTGADPAAAVALLEGMRADAIGINCSDAPAAMMPTLLACLACSSRPVLFMPNAGLPRVSEGKTVYDLSPSDFAAGMCAAAEAGASILGGCCGTTPAHIRAMTAALADRAPKPVGRKKRCTASSYTRAVSFGERPLMIGERVNPTGKPRLKEALLCRDVDYLQGEAIRQQEAGADLLDVNVGLPQIDEPRLLPEAIRAVQEVCDLPLVIDSSDPVAMEAAMRAYNGKPVVNSVNGREESLRRVLPLVRKYGGVAIALTIDEGGVPPTAEGRLAVARRILAAGREYGLTKDDFLFDPLAMTVSADPSAASVTLRSLALIRDRLGARTSLGVSNVSYGLPARDGVNAAFLTLALSEGLSAAIANPLSPAMRGALCAFLALSGRDRDFSGYLAYAAALSGAPAAPVAPSDGESLSSAIRSGRRDHAAALTEALLREHDPLAVNSNKMTRPHSC